MVKGGGERVKKRKSEISLAIDQLSSLINNEEEDDEKKTRVSTAAFLALSNLLLQVVDRIGPTMAVLSLDIRRNIERVEKIYVHDPSRYSSLSDIIDKEVKDGIARKPDSCSKSILWLSRSMDLAVEILKEVEKNSEMEFKEIIEEAYRKTLKPWHGWISSAAYKIALKLIPEREIFVGLLKTKGEDYEIFQGQILKFAASIQPLLDEIHELMRKFRLERLKST
ncbi:hypothetical protein LUZ60_004558 [Juncus effusus]|nr:hypothetical protein LUZ60_004558 [Juncus effusus]